MISKAVGLVAKFAGPKVLLGVIIASTSAITFLVFQWQSALEDKAIAQQNTQTYITALAESEAELTRERETRMALNDAIEKRRQREQAARERARAAESKLASLEQSNEAVSDWSDSRVPGDVRDWLRDD